MKEKKKTTMYMSFTQHLPFTDYFAVDVKDGDLNIHFHNGLYIAFKDLGNAKKLGEEILYTIKQHKKELEKLKKEK